MKREECKNVLWHGRHFLHRLQLRYAVEKTSGNSNGVHVSYNAPVVWTTVPFYEVKSCDSAGLEQKRLLKHGVRATSRKKNTYKKLSVIVQKEELMHHQCMRFLPVSRQGIADYITQFPNQAPPLFPGTPRVTQVFVPGILVASSLTPMYHFSLPQLLSHCLRISKQCHLAWVRKAGRSGVG